MFTSKDFPYEKQAFKGAKMSPRDSQTTLTTTSVPLSVEEQSSFPITVISSLIGYMMLTKKKGCSEIKICTKLELHRSYVAWMSGSRYLGSLKVCCRWLQELSCFSPLKQSPKWLGGLGVGIIWGRKQGSWNVVPDFSSVLLYSSEMVQGIKTYYKHCCDAKC